MVSRKVLIPMAAVAVIGAAGYGASRASASVSSTGHPSLVQQIADTFHLDPAKVQTVFDQNKADRQAQAETRYEQRLTQAVTDGKITSAQQSAILAEHNKLKSELTGGTSMQQIRTEAQDWAKQNNVQPHWLLGGRPLRGTGPMGHNIGASPSPRPSE